MDAELNNKIKEIGSLFGLNELPDNMDEIVNSVLNNIGNNNSQLDKINCEQNVNANDNQNDLTGDIDITKILELLNKYRQSSMLAKNDDKIKLLYALRPFLNDKRKSKLKNCVTMLTLAKMVEIKWKDAEL